MTGYTLTIGQGDYALLLDHLLAEVGIEQAAYLICRMSRSASEARLIVQDVIPVTPADVVEASSVHMRISSRSFTRAMKRADDRGGCLVFVHSHPNGFAAHSAQDDREEARLFRTAYIRIRTPGVHGSLILSRHGIAAARIWLPDGSTAPIERVRIIGKRFRFWFSGEISDPVPDFFDRQVRAFGADIQKLLARLRVGVVGAGGTGSCITEQLIRLGVGELVIADGQSLEASNTNRVYGSRVIDDGIPKVKLVQRLAADIGLGTRTNIIEKPITFRSVLEEFRACDIIFACTDDQWGRSLLNRLAVYYLIPTFDLGIKIDSENGVIRSIQGRVTTLLPGAACLYCRGRISAATIAAESLHALDPERAGALRDEGYIPELADPAPAVIPFTTAVAATAITEFLHRLTGCLGADRDSNEVLHLIDDTRVRTNKRLSAGDCFCGDRRYCGRSDAEPFLDLTWRPE
jgi:hypothetical protein